MTSPIGEDDLAAWIEFDRDQLHGLIENLVKAEQELAENGKDAHA